MEPSRTKEDIAMCSARSLGSKVMGARRLRTRWTGRIISQAAKQPQRSSQSIYELLKRCRRRREVSPPFLIFSRLSLWPTCADQAFLGKTRDNGETVVMDADRHGRNDLPFYRVLVRRCSDKTKDGPDRGSDSRFASSVNVDLLPGSKSRFNAWPSPVLRVRSF